MCSSFAAKATPHTVEYPPSHSRSTLYTVASPDTRSGHRSFCKFSKATGLVAQPVTEVKPWPIDLKGLQCISAQQYFWLINVLHATAMCAYLRGIKVVRASCCISFLEIFSQ